LGLKPGLKRSAQQVVNRLEVQEYQVGEDVQEIHGWSAFVLADPGSGQMALNMQRGKQLLDPQFQVGAEIFQGRFDLPLKVSEFPVMQEKAPFCVVLLVISQSYLTTNLEPFPCYWVVIKVKISNYPLLLGAKLEL